MRFVDEYRSADVAKRVSEEIARVVVPGRRYKIMEVCGGHTHAIYKHGVEDLLPPEIELVHGPGCPVCVIPMGRQDDAIAIAQHDDVIFTTFGDMMRVPASHGSLLDAKARGADVRMVYSPLDALPDRPPEPRAARRVLRDRLRDHCSVDRPDAPARRVREKVAP